MKIKRKYIWLMFVTALLIIASISMMSFDLMPSVNATKEIDTQRIAIEELEMQADEEEATAKNIVDAVTQHLTEGDPEVEAPNVIRINKSANYALTTWTWGEAGGQALLQLKEDVWTVIEAGGGAMNESTLLEAGVPQEEVGDLLDL